MESHKIPWFQTTNQTSIYRGYPIVMFDFHTGYHKKNHATWSIPRIGIRFITRIFSQYNPVHVVKTMSFLPPVTGNGKFIPTNFMVTGGWCVCAFMALFLPTSQMGKKTRKTSSSTTNIPPGQTAGQLKFQAVKAMVQWIQGATKMLSIRLGNLPGFTLA